VRYTYTKGGFEQDIVIQQQLPAPESFGLNSQTTWLQVWTEFTNAPTPQITEQANFDQYLDFGPMQMGSGRAFVIGDEADSAPVRKHWVTLGDRTCLLEEVQFSAVAAQLQGLPSGGSNSPSARNQLEGFPKRLPPRPKLAKQGGGGLKVASLPAREKGLVLDYQAVSSSSNYTFQGDTTYYVSGAVTLTGTTTAEGGAVIKYASGTNIGVTMNGPLVSLTGPYRPAVLTTMNDNSLGATITGSTGTPTNTLATYLVGGSGQTNDYKNLRLLYAGTGVSNSSAAVTVWNSQFVNCGTAVASGGGSGTNGTVTLRNVLVTQATNCVFTSGSVVAEHLTADQCQVFCTPTNFTGASVTNSIIAGVTNQTGVTAAYSVTNGSGLFQTAAGGNYYLADESPYRNAGTASVNSNLLSQLLQKTTSPPIVLSSAFGSNTILYPQAQRDTEDPPDLGFHYDVLDYVWSNLAVNSGVNLTLTNGVAIGLWGATGMTVNGSLISRGSPLYLDRLLGCCMVQEQRLTAMTNLIGGNGAWSSLDLRFTDLPTLGGSVTYLNVTDASAILNAGSLTLRDCQLLGGTLTVWLGRQCILLQT
jgi:hypothetical protein